MSGKTLHKNIKKGINSDSTGKESNEEFLKRILKTKDEATKKASEELDSYSKSKEVEGLKATGKTAAKNLKEIEECERIVEEFKINPPVVISKHVNGISVEYRYEDKYKDKIELLKKHYFSFLSVAKNTSITSPIFKTFGKAYVKRRGQRILLPESAIPPLNKGFGMGATLLNPNDSVFILENKDVIETGSDSCVKINDFIANDDYKREVFVCPNSELELNLTKKESHPAPAFMDPSQVPEIIKKNSSSTVIEYNFVSCSFIKGIFQIIFLDKNKNVNTLLKLPSGYPDIEFLHSSKMIENIQDKVIAKMPANVVAMYNAKAGSRSSKICDEINTYIEFCKDKSIVVFGTGNSVKNKSNGKIAIPNLPKVTPKDFIITSKITVRNNNIYSDNGDLIDPRARAIVKNRFVIEQYYSLLNSKKEYEQKLKESKENPKTVKIESIEDKKEKEKRKAELKEQLDYYKKCADNDMINATQMQLDEIEPPKETEAMKRDKEQMKKELLETLKHSKEVGNMVMADTIQLQLGILTNPQNATASTEDYYKKMIDWCNTEIAKLKPDLNTNFPNYNSPRETDLI